MKAANPIPPAAGIITEFREGWTESAMETFCAFLNTHGGEVYFGVADDGRVVGVRSPEDVVRSVHSVMRSAIEPDASQQCRTRTIVVDGRSVVVAAVLQGRKPPYWVKEAPKDGKPARCCYLRKGTRNYLAAEDELRNLFRKGDPTPCELRVSARQDLSFEAAAKYFERAGAALSAHEYGVLGLTNQAGLFTNLAYWLSDQCTAETRVGFFSGTDKASAIGGILTFSGSILEQCHRILMLLNDRFGFSAGLPTFDWRRDGSKQEVTAYPEAAIREALMHAFFQRDFSIPSPSTISCFSDRMEFLSLGGLRPEADSELLRLGAWIPRNPKLAELLLRLSGLDKYDIGTPLMYSSYAPYGLAPKLQAFPRAFLIALPKISLLPGNWNGAEAQILEFLRRHGPAKRAAIQSLLGKSYGFVINTLNSLMNKGVIVRDGAGRNTKYRIL